MIEKRKVFYRIIKVTPELARYEKYKLGWFSTEVSNDSADGKIVSDTGGFSILHVLIIKQTLLDP